MAVVTAWPFSEKYVGRSTEGMLPKKRDHREDPLTPNRSLYRQPFRTLCLEMTMVRSNPVDGCYGEHMTGVLYQSI